MPHLDLATHCLHYRIDDAGTAHGTPWLVFCNSLGTELGMWDSQAAELFRDFRVLRYDRRGHGRSSAPPPPYGLDELGHDVIALLDALGIERAHFCGLSIGGLVGQWLGINAGQRFDKIVVCATAAKIGTEESWNARIADVRANGLSALAAATAERWFSPDFRHVRPATVGKVLDSFVATSIDGYVGCCAALAGADLRSEIGRIANPLLAVAGQDDPVCPLADLEQIATTVIRGRHLSLPGRHILNVESSDAFNVVLREFLLG